MYETVTTERELGAVSESFQVDTYRERTFLRFDGASYSYRLDSFKPLATIKIPLPSSSPLRQAGILEYYDTLVNEVATQPLPAELVRQDLGPLPPTPSLSNCLMFFSARTRSKPRCSVGPKVLGYPTFLVEHTEVSAPGDPEPFDVAVSSFVAPSLNWASVKTTRFNNKTGEQYYSQEWTKIVPGDVDERLFHVSRSAALTLPAKMVHDGLIARHKPCPTCVLEAEQYERDAKINRMGPLY